MTPDEYAATVDAVAPALRKLLKAYDGGPLTDAELAAKTSLGQGRRDLRNKLAQRGLLRKQRDGYGHVVKRKTRMPGESDVEYVMRKGSRESWEATPRPRSRRRPRTMRSGPPAGEAPPASMRAMRPMEPGSWKQWEVNRANLLSVTIALQRVDAMAFWDAAPANERGQIRYEVLEQLDWCLNVLDALDIRAESDKRYRRAAKMGRTAERPTTPAAERETAIRLRAAELRRVPPRIGERPSDD